MYHEPVGAIPTHSSSANIRLHTFTYAVYRELRPRTFLTAAVLCAHSRRGFEMHGLSIAPQKTTTIRHGPILTQMATAVARALNVALIACPHTALLHNTAATRCATSPCTLTLPQKPSLLLVFAASTTHPTIEEIDQPVSLSLSLSSSL